MVVGLRIINMTRQNLPKCCYVVLKGSTSQCVIRPDHVYVGGPFCTAIFFNKFISSTISYLYPHLNKLVVHAMCSSYQRQALEICIL